jgi:class 3 adenylate cyclase
MLVPIIEDNDGILLKVEGDSFMVIFRNVQKGIRASISMQRTLRDYNRTRPAEEHVLLSVGLGFGRVLRIGDADVFGAEVNAASKLGEDIAKAYEILVTKAVRDAADDVEGASFEPMQQMEAFRLTWRDDWSMPDGARSTS